MLSAHFSFHLKSNNNCWFLISNMNSAQSHLYICTIHFSTSIASNTYGPWEEKRLRAHSTNKMCGWWLFFSFYFVSVSFVIVSVEHFQYTSYLIESFHLKNAHEITMWIDEHGIPNQTKVYFIQFTRLYDIWNGPNYPENCMRREHVHFSSSCLSLLPFENEKLLCLSTWKWKKKLFKLNICIAFHLQRVSNLLVRILIKYMLSVPDWILNCPELKAIIVDVSSERVLKVFSQCWTFIIFQILLQFI